MKLNFLLIGEGSSDIRLTNHIENILIEEGFDEVSGEAPDLSLFPTPIGRSIKEKLSALMRFYPHADIIFVHRDADNAGVAQRLIEIKKAVDDLNLSINVIPIIPVTMLETWLLADVNAIKKIAGKPKTLSISCIPAINRLESCADTKRVLMDALCEASETQGHRLQKFKGRFCEMRARLTTDLDHSGPVNELPSYKDFRLLISGMAENLLRSYQPKI
ncbi:hypothetical protein IFT43_00865 [Oxalobacteraceae sp. CFBP 13708]|nr:hypothetical protein [Oxalobacteraceae sp. CFBP 13708]